MENKLNLKNFGALIISGGSSGIGSSFIASTLNINPSCLVCNISRQKPQNFSQNPTLHHYSCDLSDPDQIKKTTQDICSFIHQKDLKKPILFVNNAGFGSYGPYENSNLNHESDLIDVNIKAILHLTHQFLPLLKNHGGAIINIASTAGFQPTPYLATYGASKAFVLNWSMALSEELAGTNVHCMCVCPGPTSTNFFKRAGFDQPPLPQNSGQTPDQVLEEALSALEKRKKLVVTGWKNKIISSISSKLPIGLISKLSAYILKKIRQDARNQ